MQIEENVVLAPFTTLKIGGPARYLIRISAESELLEAVAFAGARKLPIFTLGGGSNLVVADAGYPGVVLHIALPESIVRSEQPDGVFFDVSAGTDWNALVLRVCEQGISGMECLAGIPGLVGGSPIQNIGAYGQEVSQIIDQVRALDLQSLEFVTLSREECGFAYRTSRFNSTDRARYIVTSVRFRLQADAQPNLSYADLAPLRGTNPTPLDVYHAVRAIRERKGMLIDPESPAPDSRSAGSFFKNPIVPTDRLARIAGALEIDKQAIPHWPAGAERLKLPAAWLIERAGFPKGYAESPESSVAISSRHTLALVNRTGQATCAELLKLRDHLVAEVQSRFGIALEQEPVTLT